MKKLIFDISPNGSLLFSFTSLGVSWQVILFLILSFSCTKIYSQVWERDSSTGFIPRTLPTSAVINNSIYIIGGGPYDGNKVPLQIFDPFLHVWATPSINNDTNLDLTLARIIGIIGEKIYVLFEDREDSLFIFDPTLNVWYIPAISGIFNQERSDLASSVVNGKIYVMGGFVGDLISTNILEVFDSSTNTWSRPKTSGVFTKRYGLTSSVVDGKIYAMGGNAGPPNYNVLNTLEVFDPSTSTWSTPITTGRFTPRQYLTSSVVDGKIYAIGGDTEGTIRPVNILEVFDPKTNIWSTPKTSGNFTPRMQLSSSVVNNKIYVLGGYTPHQELNTVEVFDPSQNIVYSIPLGGKISLLDNPVSTAANFQFDAMQSGESFELFDFLGRRLLRRIVPTGEMSLHIDMQNYPAGVYLARLGNDVIRVIKQ